MPNRTPDKILSSSTHVGDCACVRGMREFFCLQFLFWRNVAGDQYGHYIFVFNGTVVTKQNTFNKYIVYRFHASTTKFIREYDLRAQVVVKPRLVTRKLSLVRNSGMRPLIEKCSTALIYIHKELHSIY